MHKRKDAIIYSASDLVAFLECSHLTTLNLTDLDTPLTRAAPDEQVEILQQGLCPRGKLPRITARQWRAPGGTVLQWQRC